MTRFQSGKLDDAGDSEFFLICIVNCLASQNAQLHCEKKSTLVMPCVNELKTAQV